MNGPRQLVRLRDVRVSVAARTLEQKREETRQADAAKVEAEAQAHRVRDQLADSRSALSHDPNDAATLLALIDHRRFQYAVAHSAFNDAIAALDDCARLEAQARTALLQARVRHDALADHVTLLEQREARRVETRLADEATDASADSRRNR